MQLADKDFKPDTVNIFSSLKEDVNEHMWNFSEEMEVTGNYKKRTQLKVLSWTCNYWNVNITRWIQHQIEESRNYYWTWKSNRNYQSKDQREKDWRKMNCFRAMWDNIKLSGIGLSKSPKKEEKAKGSE